MRIIDVTYPFLVLFVIYLYQKVQHHDTVIAKIDKNLDVESHFQRETPGSEILNNESDYKKEEEPHRDTMKEDLVHHDETKRDKSMNQNRRVSREASHSTNDKHRYGRNDSMIQKSDYIKSFDAAHGIRNKKKTVKELWAKQQSFPDNSRKVMKSQKPAGDDGLKKLKQEQNLHKKSKQLDRNLDSKKKKDNISTMIERFENNLKNEKDLRKINKSSEGIEKINVGNRRVKSYMNEATSSTTSCVLTKAEIIPFCDDDKYDDCSKWALDGYCTNSTFMSNADGTFKDWMIENCRKSCDACLSSVYLLDSQLQEEEYDNAITFNLSLDVATDDYAYETSWLLTSRESEDSIFNSSEVNITSELQQKEYYYFNYYCTVPPTEENKLTDEKKSTCYSFEVHDSHGDGGGEFILYLRSMNNKIFRAEKRFEDGSVMSTSFCLDHNNGDIESEGKFIIDGDEEVSEVLTDYPSPSPTDQPSHLEIHTTDTNTYHTSCVATKDGIMYDCDDNSSSCGFRASIGDCSKPDEKDWMHKNCPKSCNIICSSLTSLENQIQQEEYKNITTTFNLSLNVNTDSHAKDTSWILFPKDGKDSIFYSNETNATTQLVNNTKHIFNYNCFISQNEESEDQLNEETKSTCYNFEVHDSFGDGMCCKYGDGLFSMNINTKSASLMVEDNFEDGYLMSTSFCIGHDTGEIESEGKFITTEQPPHSHYPFRRWQCRNQPCICDSKPSLTANTQENHTFLLQVTMLSGSDKLQDVESAQYMAACWVLYDDPYEYDLVDERKHKRMIQRYILAVIYFGTSPENWEEHCDFLSSNSECDWNYIEWKYYYGSLTYGISCNEDDTVISIDLGGNNLDGSIVEELSGLRMLEELDLGFNYNIRGTIPLVLSRLSNLHSLDLRKNKLEGTISPQLSRLSNLRYLSLGGNELEGTIPPQLFDATNLEELWLTDNRLEGTIPETIGNLQKLIGLSLGENNLSGSIPDVIYSLKNLQYLDLSDNKLSSSISPLIGNLNKLERLYLYDNMLTGQIPSTIGSLSSLEWLSLSNNTLSGSIPSTIGNMKSLIWLYLNNSTLSGPIPESLFDLPYLPFLYLQDNSVTGSVPEKFCERLSDDYYYGYTRNIFADCRNDVFEPEVTRCSCCTCKDESPIWDGDCADATVKVVIDHESIGVGSRNLEWSLTNNDAAGKKILNDGPYKFEEGLATYEACVAYSDCLSINQISPPVRTRDYYIYWNNISIHNGTFQGFVGNPNIKEYDPPQTLLSFQYNEENQHLSKCYDITLVCYEEVQSFLLEPNTTERIMYDQAVKLSGRSTIQDTSSPQSKALCWMLSNNHYYNKINVSDTEYEQRYILAILQFMSPGGLFGGDEHPPDTHECEWNGITCKDNSKIVTGISLSNQIINGDLIDEIGSLKYLEVINLSQMHLPGTIPRSFSNLWSLTTLDLSGNKISGTMPASLFRQLNKLEHMDLSDNLLSGSINDDIGSFSHIRVLSMRNNSLTGSFPLDSFKYYDLEHLDISENELSGIDFSLLLKHRNLKTLAISSNFLLGSLLDDTFTSLAKLEFFNVSQNDFSGTIPSTFSELSNMTHFDIHANRFKGTIPLRITELLELQHINLQGNQLTGSLPSELNKLKNLDTLVLSHNELKGSIPFDPMKLENMERLHLHSNKLEGEAPRFHNIISYITDCGFPSDLSDSVTCPSCSTCCNSLDRCRVTKVDQGERNRTLIFSFILIGLLILSYLVKDQIISLRKFEPFFSRSVSQWNPLTIMNDKSVYHFLLTNNKIGWRVALGTGAFQILTLFLFVLEASSYSLKCPFYSLKCEDTEPGINASPLGLLLFGLILIIWLTRDLVSSLKLLLIALYKKNIDIMFTGGLVFFITALAAWTSIYYNFATVTTDHELIVNTVILLFVLEADERIYQFAESFTPQWVIDEARFRESAMFDGDELIISSWIRKRLRKRSSMPSQMSKNEEEEEGEEGDNGDGNSREMNLNETCQVEKLP